MSAATATPVLMPTKPRVDFDRDVEERLEQGDDGSDYEGWWCIKTNPFHCPAHECGFVTEYATAAHRILVWPERDDMKILGVCALMQQVEHIVKRNPRIVPFESGFGPSISYYQWEAIGRPVHQSMLDAEGNAV